MQTRTQAYKGNEYEIHTGSLYYITANQTYEPYYEQFKLPNGNETEGVSVVTGEYIMTKEDGVVPINITSQNAVDGMNNPAAFGNAQAAEINRLQKLVASQHQQIVALQQQVANQVMTPAGISAHQIAVPVQETAQVDPFTDALEAAAAAGNRRAA